jgi:N-acylneuraminate cytidylyltransferase
VLHAQAARSVTRVVVSTEDEEIAGVARALGADVPFLRPRELAEDDVLDLPVFAHVLSVLAERERYRPDVVVHLRPTAPYRRAEWIDQAVQALVARADATSLRSVSPPVAHPYRMFTIDSEGLLDPLMKHVHPEPYLLRRQDLPPVWHYNCVLDVTRPATIEGGSMTGARILPFPMSAEDVVDIDTPRDLAIARHLFGDEP